MANLVNADEMRQMRDGQALSTVPLHIQVKVCSASALWSTARGLIPKQKLIDHCSACDLSPPVGRYGTTCLDWMAQQIARLCTLMTSIATLLRSGQNGTPRTLLSA